MRAAAGLILAALLGGCATPAPIVIKLRPDPVYLADCPHPDVDVSTNGGIATGLLAYRTALDLCNNDKEALREWDKGVP